MIKIKLKRKPKSKTKLLLLTKIIITLLLQKEILKKKHQWFKEIVKNKLHKDNRKLKIINEKRSITKK
jgi:hypothetical protein